MGRTTMPLPISTAQQHSIVPPPRLLIGIAIVVVLLVTAALWATHRLPALPGDPNREQTKDRLQGQAAQTHHGDKDQSHAPHSEHRSIELSENALKNIGFQPVTMELGTFERTITIPGIVVEQAGQTQIHLTTPLTGIVSKINVIVGEAVQPGTPMFHVRLTHEDVVTAQRDYLLTSENLDIVTREIERLTSIGEGVIARKQILEQQYEKQKLAAALLAGEQALLLHGLTDQHIVEIRQSKRLVQSLTIRAPNHSHAGDECAEDHLFHVQSLSVSQGQQVQAGEKLAVLADHCELFVEGRAFEDDAKVLREAVRHDWNVSATLLSGDGQAEKIEDLKLLYLADQIDPESRAFHFYLRLPNEIVLDQKSARGQRFIEWRFKPGQRLELRVPIELWTDRLVLPVGAVVEEGAEMYVYRQNGDHFDQVPVHVEYRDRDSMVIANDGSLFPGDVVAGQGAYQIHLALKHTAGGGVQPHGHHH